MKIKELRELDTKALNEKLQNAQDELRQQKLNHSVSPLENPSTIKGVRRDIARIKTELRQRELNEK
jgi:large subunit ribosomal protein L29